MSASSKVLQKNKWTQEAKIYNSWYKKKAIVNDGAPKLFNEQMFELHNEYKKKKSNTEKHGFCSRYNISDLFLMIMMIVIGLWLSTNPPYSYLH